MCGIAGIVGTAARDPATLADMASSLAHRGPDGEGIWQDIEVGIGLVHRRLAVVDLSPAGRQPMASSDGRWIATYNGEIYNHLELRKELETGDGLNTRWRGHSDTETLVECIAAWGLEATLHRAVGMFAIALWDRRDRVLSLARDRFGEKPLYFGWVGGDFVFASELKALRTHPGFDNPVDRRAVQLLTSRSYVPAPLSIYQYIYKLEPGCILAGTAEALRVRQAEPPTADAFRGGIRVHRYWSYREVVAHGLADPILDEDEALARLDLALADSIRSQAVADVPVGAFLSGGIDSSAIVSLYQKHSNSQVRTFTIGFDEAGFNEADHAKAVAAHLGTDHNELYVTAIEAQQVIPRLPTIYDEPFADSSQIPTFLVSRFAREQVTVALTGDGGDELFGGYNRYISAARLWSRLRRMPAPARRMASWSMAGIPPSTWNRMLGLLPGGPRPPHLGTKVQKGLRAMGAVDGLAEIFAAFLDEWSGQPSPLRDAQRDACPFDLDLGIPAPDATRMMYCDAKSYLPDDILCKIDRAAMAVSLEGRVPFLDHRVASVAARIPLSMKIRGGEGKQVLRRLLYREAPAALFERPKAGFGIPVGEWIKGPLRPWAEELLDSKRLEDQGFNAAAIRARWSRHLEGRADSTAALWAILMFQGWQEGQALPPTPSANRDVRQLAVN